MSVRDVFLFVVVGLGVWLIDTYAIPDGMFKTVFRVIVALALVAWLFTTFGLMDKVLL